MKQLILATEEAEEETRRVSIGTTAAQNDERRQKRMRRDRGKEVGRKRTHDRRGWQTNAIWHQ